jgi:cytochrome b561
MASEAQLADPIKARSAYAPRTRAIHWVMALLILTQIILAWMMLWPGGARTVAGFSRDALYNWHKSLGLVAFAFALYRIWNRRRSPLPPWAPTLTNFEKTLIHKYETALYVAMFVLPISGFVFVMAGSYGVNLFGIAHLPNPIPRSPALAVVAHWIHWLSAYVLIGALVLHIGLVLRHTLILRDGLLRRML